MSASQLPPPLPSDWRASLDAYEAWHTTVPGLTGHYAKQAWQAAWEACTQHHGIKRNVVAHSELSIPVDDLTPVLGSRNEGEKR